MTNDQLEPHLVRKLLRALQRDLRGVVEGLTLVSRQAGITEDERQVLRSVARKIDKVASDVLMSEDLLEQGRAKEVI